MSTIFLARRFKPLFLQLARQEGVNLVVEVTKEDEVAPESMNLWRIYAFRGSAAGSKPGPRHKPRVCWHPSLPLTIFSLDQNRFVLSQVGRPARAGHEVGLGGVEGLLGCELLGGRGSGAASSSGLVSPSFVLFYLFL